MSTPICSINALPNSSHLGLEGVVLLAEVLLPEVVRVAPAVPPLEDLVLGDVDVLEVLVLVVPVRKGCVIEVRRVQKGVCMRCVKNN